MRSYEIEGVCLPVFGYENDDLYFADGDCLGITDLITRAGGTKTDDMYRSAFEFHCSGSLDRGESYSAEFWRARVSGYRADTGREYPPIYRVKIAVTLEEVSAEETRAYWEAPR